MRTHWQKIELMIWGYKYFEIMAFEKGNDIDRSTPAGIRVRRHPVRSAAFKIAVGVAAGAIVGFAFVLIAYNVIGWRPLVNTYLLSQYSYLQFWNRSMSSML